MGGEEAGKQYRERADQMMVIAEGMSDQKSKDFLTKVAVDYLRAASDCEALAKPAREPVD